MVRHKLTIVVTPLLALAKDQIENANEHDIEAASWSSQTSESMRATLARDIVSDSGSLRLLYTTPESLQSPRLLELLKVAHEASRLCCLAVDEAHACVSWGFDFRPSYLALGAVRSALPLLPCLAVTATATEDVRNAIIDILRLQNPTVLVNSANRPELQFSE
jgi:superfamily II DNA helicase RecQ